MNKDMLNHLALWKYETSQAGYVNLKFYKKNTKCLHEKESSLC